MLDFSTKYLIEDETKYQINSYNSVELDYTLSRYYKIKDILPDNLSKYKSYRSKTEDTYCYIRSIGDAFVIINIYLEYVLTLLENLTNKINDIIKLKENENTNNTEQLLLQLNTLKSQYNNLFIVLDYEHNDKLLVRALQVLKEVNIDPTFILNKLKQIKPAI